MKSLMPFLLLIAVSQLSGQAQPASLIGRWKIEVVFPGGEEHAVEFNAAASGKGTYLLLDARSSLLPPAEPSKAEWEVRRRQVRISGEIKFPIGNVGRNAGTLILQGNFSSPDSISGTVAFYRPEQDPKDPRTAPARTGRFNAKRVPALRAGYRH